MRMSPVVPRSSCAAACRCAPHRGAALLGRCLAASAPPSARSQLHSNTISRRKPSRFVSARCSSGNASGPSGDGDGPGERGQPPPAAAGAATGEGCSTPKEAPDSRPSDSKTYRQQQALDLLIPLLREALVAPLLEEQVDIRAALERHEAGQREVLHMLRALAVEVQQQEQPKEQQEQQAEFSQPLASTLAAYNDPKTLQSSVPIISPLQMTCEQFMKRAPRLMDYVRIRKPGEYDNAEGVVLGSSRCGTRLKVWTLPDPQHCGNLNNASRTVICGPDECEPLASIMPSQRGVQYLPKNKGVPVTPVTAAPGMLVRRGYDLKEGEEGETAAGEVGVLRATPDMSGLGRAWVVEWASGSQGVYETGWGGRFELVHLETSRTSGAPVVGRYSWLLGDTELAELRDLHEQACIYLLKLQSLHAHTSGGMAVERGTHWLYGGADPGVGITKSKTQGQEGCVAVEWPNGQLLHHHASPRDGYDLCYSARPGDPVTLFTARQGLRVAVVRGGAQGVLVRPKGVSQGDIMWQVEFGEKKKRPDIILYDASGRHNSSASILASELQFI